MNIKYKKQFVILIIIIILALGSMILLSQRGNNSVKHDKGLSSIDKKLLKYNYEIPNNLQVFGIMSDKELVIEESNELKLYDMINRKPKTKLADISDGFKVVKVIVFDKGIVWVEKRTTPDILSKVYIKYFSSSKVNLLDESKSDILPYISLSPSSKYLSYYIVNGDKVNVKFSDLDKNAQKTIAVYDLNNENGVNLVTAPNSDDTSIVWSYSTDKNSSIFKYNINNGEIEKLSNTDLSQPVIKNNKIVAIKRYDFYNSDKKVTYASDYIVQYDYNAKQWVKFADGKIDNYIEGHEESITNLSVNKGLFYWVSTLSNGKCVYDFEYNKFIPLADKDAKKVLQTSIKIVKDNLVYYEAQDYNNNVSHFFYIVK